MTPEQAIVPPFLRRVVIHNFKSIEVCDVRLGPRTILVGRNGAGKSNFLDALHFVADALQTSLAQAIGKRGGMASLCRQSAEWPRTFSISLEFGLPYHKHCEYTIELSAESANGSALIRERLKAYDSSGRIHGNFERAGSEIFAIKTWQTDSPLMPRTRADRLYLMDAAAWPAFGEPFDALRAMRFYQPNPVAMREIRRTEPYEILRGDGANIASAVGQMETRTPRKLERITQYLRLFAPEISSVQLVSLGPSETLLFEQKSESPGEQKTFYAANMSDGTLRALAILVAAHQRDKDGATLRLIGVEEPETALHPAAAGALMEALHEVEADTQVVLTTHSADFLDEVDPSVDTLLVVTSDNGSTHIAPVDAASLSAVKQHLYSLGDLLRMDQLQGEKDHGNDSTLSPSEVEVS
jgi:predicted ATPase